MTVTPTFVLCLWLLMFAMPQKTSCPVDDPIQQISREPLPIGAEPCQQSCENAGRESIWWEADADLGSVTWLAWVLGLAREGLSRVHETAPPTFKASMYFLSLCCVHRQILSQTLDYAFVIWKPGCVCGEMERHEWKRSSQHNAEKGRHRKGQGADLPVVPVLKSALVCWADGGCVCQVF